MFFGLRHPAVVGSDDEEREVNGSNASYHVADEVFVSGNVDNSDVKALAAR